MKKICENRTVIIIAHRLSTVKIANKILVLDKGKLVEFIENRKIHLSAGMNINAEIKTGKRRIISYLLSPLQSGIEESFKER